jgi:hypothetical protein
MFTLPRTGATDVAYDIGQHTAQLEPNGLACGGLGRDQDRRVGASDVAIEWTVQTFDGDLNPLGETSSVTTDAVDDVISLTAPAVYFSICAHKRSQQRATLAFDVIEL